MNYVNEVDGRGGFTSVILLQWRKVKQKRDSMEQTLVIIKPDAVQRGIIGEIISRFEKVGLKIIGGKLIKADRNLVDKHYPKEREEFIVGMANKTMENYKEQGLSLKEDFGTEDAKEIGLKIQSWLVDFLVSDPVFVMVIEGPHAIEVVRKICGFTLPSKAAPGTIRGDYSFDSSAYANFGKRPIRNLVHASGDAVEAKFEIGLWFSDGELFSYDTIHQKHMTN
jgi:nucleoside-diphosphate kinase